jgi:pilus assembly protein CpaE
MRSSRPKSGALKTKVLAVTADAAFEESVRATFASTAQIELALLSGTLAAHEDRIGGDDVAVIVIDLDTRRTDELSALTRLMGRLNGWPPVIVVTPAFDKDTARQLLQVRVADFLVKPVPPIELVRTCARVVQTPNAPEPTEAEIFTYMSAVGGAGVTTLAIQTALALLTTAPKGRSATCLVDLDFQHGACADYLDLEPRLDLKEIEPRPERLDRQLLEVMTAYHPSGLAVIAAPNHPAEMRSFDPDMVTRLLDLVSSHFNYVVIDMPRTWFSWTDSVLLGSNRLFIVSEMTVPGLKHAKQLVAAISERLGEGKRPGVIINRFEQRLLGAGLRKGDIEQTLGKDFVAAVPNSYALVREAIDRGVPLEEVKPGNRITAEINKLIAPPDKSAQASGPQKWLSLAWARS